MKNTAIIIPTRLGARRFPNKPLAKINDLPMIVHVMNRAIESKIGEVFVASADEEIINVVEKYGGKTIITKKDHLSGSDRVYEAYAKKLKDKADIIINLQGDMPNIKPDSISKIEKFMRQNKCDIGTLAAPIKNNIDMEDSNIVKVSVLNHLKNDDFLEVKDFFRLKNDFVNEKIYHHIGIYAFTSVALTKYVKLPRSKLEMERNLEQMRAMENKMVIKVGLCNSAPLGVDTQQDLIKVSEEMSL